ncbi:hypothetical protein K1719_046120 [Acacia pycnantha]|nr:hypothetical protein K1719_046120 [Acacia pycnantha]
MPILDVPTTNPRRTQASNTTYQRKVISITSMHHSIAPAKTRRSTFNARIEHHFEEEIQEAVQKHHLKLGTHSYDSSDHNDHKLSEVAFQFRLLRQQCCPIDTGVFKNFMDKKGRLKKKFWGNTEGLIELFEASQLSMDGEGDLDEIRNFTRHLLHTRMLRTNDPHEANVISDTLKYPNHKSLLKFTPRSILFPSSQIGKAWLSPLQKFSKIDTQIANSINLKEIYAVSKWWQDLGLAKDLKFAREKPIMWYMWPMACVTDPCFSEERIEITKPVSLLYIIDDIFDIYGSMVELTLFVDAVNRWDLGAIEQLPDCMKASFNALYDITSEFAIKVQNKHGWNPINTLIKSWVRLCNSFLEEAKWFNSGKLPNAEEYLKNGIVSAGVHMCLAHTFFILGQGITNETVALMDDIPELISSTSTIVRLCNDLEGAKDGKQADNDGSYLNCYLKDHPGVSVDQAKENIKHKISNAWKCLNKECFTPTNPFPSSFSKICLNAVRMIPIVYNEKYSPSRLEEHVKSLLYSDSI